MITINVAKLFEVTGAICWLVIVVMIALLVIGALVTAVIGSNTSEFD